MCYYKQSYSLLVNITNGICDVLDSIGFPFMLFSVITYTNPHFVLMGLCNTHEVLNSAARLLSNKVSFVANVFTYKKPLKIVDVVGVEGDQKQVA